MSRAALAGLLADQNVARVMSALDGAGEETRIVGGAVRNALIGAAVTDIDMATTATPDVVVERAKAAGLKVALTGYEHGTVTVISGHRPFEVTSLREDVETDGRRAKVRFGRDFDEDARRRDFTINSMSLSADGILHDPLDGRADLAERRVRFIGDARTRIAEDYLRILRFFRFHAAYGRGALDRDGLSAAIELRDGLTRLSGERVRAEILKLMVAARGPEVVREAADAGLLEFALGGVVYSSRLDGLATVEAAARLEPDAVLRLAAAAVLTFEDCERLRERLKLSNAEHKRLLAAARALELLHGRPAPPQGAALATIVFEFGADATVDALMLAQAEDASGSGGPAWDIARKAARDMGELKLPISGDDLKQRGLSEGRAIGAALKHLQARWIREGFPQDPAIIARLIDEAVAAQGE